MRGSRWRRRARRLRDRLAGQAFALAADPRPLDQAARARRRLPARGDRAGGVRRFHRASRRARLCRRQHHHPAQGGGAGDVGAGRPRARGRRRQHALVRQRPSAFDQHRRRRLHRQSRRRGAGLGEARRRSGRARRRRLGARHHLWPDRARHRQDPRGQPHAGAGARRCRRASARRCSRRTRRRCRICSAAPACWSTPPRSA